MINPDDLALARDWAGDPGEFYSGAAPLKEVARVIQALPGRVIDAEDVSALHDDMRTMMGDMGEPDNDYDKGYYAAVRDWANDIYLLLPTPPRKPAMIKRGAIAVHPEHGEVLVISNRPNESDGRVMIAYDHEETADGTFWAWTPADSLTAPDELADSGTPETDNDSADEEEVDDSSERVLAPGGAIRFKPDKTKRYRDKDGSVWGWFVGWVCRDEDGNYEASSESSVPPAMHGPYTVVGGAADQPKGDNPEDTPCNGVDEDNPEDGDAPGGIIPTGDRPLAEIKIGNWAHHNTHGQVLITANAPNAFGLVRCVIPDDHSRIANLPITDLHQEPEAGEGEEERR